MTDLQLFAFYILPIIVGIVGCLAAWLGIRFIPDLGPQTCLRYLSPPRDNGGAVARVHQAAATK